ncbi:hypothetical protein BC833DRAFT_600494 [Globomyces pollinis-pini]|nr:hypothetical protein BC833DRAFT_600494 [Globomyces pollinis-pini]
MSSISAVWNSLMIPEFYLSLCMCSFFQIALFFGCQMKWPLKFKTPIQYAWIPTTGSSFIMTFGSLPFVKDYFTNQSDLSSFQLLNSPYAIAFCAYFVSYLLADMIFGYIYYPQHMDIVTGWIHHTIYLVLIPALIHYKVPGAFMVAAVMELPTIFLAIGFLNEKFKSEILFGITFFLTRLLFHVYFVIQLYLVWPTQYTLIFFSTFTFPLHIYWFKRWTTRQLKRIRSYLSESFVQFEDHVDLTSSIDSCISSSVNHIKLEKRGFNNRLDPLVE